MSIAYDEGGVSVHLGDCREVLATLPDASVQTVVTSPPYYGLRSYLPEAHADKASEIGLEPSVDAYVAEMVAVFREVRRVLADDGTLWLNLGDSYATGTAKPRNATTTKGADVPAGWAGRSQPERIGTPDGLKTKDLIGIPWRVAFALQADGWYLRQDVIWSKPNPMPESVTDRCTKAHEYLFLLSKGPRYYFDADAIREPHGIPRKSGPNALRGQQEIRPRGNGQSITEQSCHPLGRNKRSVWEITPEPFTDAHFATFPRKLVEPCVLAGSRPSDVVLDPFAGSGTTLQVAKHLGRRAVGIELNPEYLPMIGRRLAQQVLALEAA